MNFAKIIAFAALLIVVQACTPETGSEGDTQ